MKNLFALIAAGVLSLGVYTISSAQDPSATVRTVRISLQASGPITAQPEDQKGATRLTESPVAAIAGARVTATAPGTSRRRPEHTINYSDDHLVVVGVDGSAMERTRIAIIDPRLIRVEKWFNDDGKTATRRYRPLVEFSVAIDDPEVVAIRILKPAWNGSEWQFTDIAEAPIQ